jgi:prepilin-type processing-associated H-X9-DG protein
MHTGGGHFALVDGSVKFVSDNVDYTIYRNMSTMMNGETPSSVD